MEKMDVLVGQLERLLAKTEARQKLFMIRSYPLVANVSQNIEIDMKGMEVMLLDFHFSVFGATIQWGQNSLDHNYFIGGYGWGIRMPFVQRLVVRTDQVGWMTVYATSAYASNIFNIYEH